MIYLSPEKIKNIESISVDWIKWYGYHDYRTVIKISYRASFLRKLFDLNMDKFVFQCHANDGKIYPNQDVVNSIKKIQEKIEKQ